MLKFEEKIRRQKVKACFTTCNERLLEDRLSGTCFYDTCCMLLYVVCYVLLSFVYIVCVYIIDMCNIQLYQRVLDL